MRKSKRAVWCAALITLIAVWSASPVAQVDAATPLSPQSRGPLAPAAVNNAFESLNPARLLDTRPGIGTIDGEFAGTGPIGSAQHLDLAVVGRGGVPNLGVGAVAINVTAVTPTRAGFLTIWPFGSPQPNASNLNFVPGDIVPNMVVVRVGTDGKISIFNESGSTHVLVDVVGWFADNAGLQPVVPERFLDTRPGTATIDGESSGGGALGPESVLSLPVVGRGSVPATGVTAVVLNVTVTAPTGGGYMTVWPSDAAQPNASSLNFVPGNTVPNLVITKVGADGRVKLFNSAGTTQVIVDVLGWFGVGSELNPLVPARLVDTRPGAATIDGLFAGIGPIGSAQSLDLVVVGRGEVPGLGVGAVLLNVTVTAPTASSFVTVWPNGFTQPNASSLNFTAGKTVANLVIAQVGVGGAVSFYNDIGAVHLIADVLGWIAPNVPLTMNQFNLLPGEVGQPFSQSLSVTGSQPPYLFAALGMNAGLSMDTNGAITGTPTGSGTRSTLVGVQDRFGRVGALAMPHSVFPESADYVSIAPTTVLNTFTEPDPLPGSTTRTLTVGGVGGVPASGVVPVLSIFIQDYTGGYVTFWPSSSPMPNGAHVSLDPFEVGADIVVVPMSGDGKINLFTSGSIDARVDVVGYMATGGAFTALASAFRVIDTRLSLNPFAPGDQRDFTLAGAGAVPSTGVTDVLLIVSSVEATAPGSFTIWDTGATMPPSPAMRWTQQSTTQLVVGKLGADGRITVRNSSSTASAHLVVDVVGFFA